MPTYRFSQIQPDHGLNHIKKGEDLRVGDTVIAHLVYNNAPVDSEATVSSIDPVNKTFKFTEWGDDAYPWADYGLCPWEPGTTFGDVDVGGMFHPLHWLERVADN